MVKWNGPFRSDWSNQEKWSTSKGGPIFSKVFRLDRSSPFSFRPKFPEILVEWITPLDFIHFFNTITLHYLQKLPTLLTMLIVDIKSRRFVYQSGRAGDEAKACKSPAKSGRVDISVIRYFELQVLLSGNTGC